MRTGFPVDLRLVWGGLRHGAGDPTVRFVGDDEAWRATRTPDGPATVAARAVGDEVRASAWGPGAEWLLDSLPAMVGATDRVEGFEPRHRVVAELWRRLPGFRLPSTGRVVEALVPSIIEQKVQGKDAWLSYRQLVWRFGEAAPGPARLRVPPSPSVLAELPTWAYHCAGIERKRADTVRLVASCAARLEETASLPPPVARAHLQVLAGVGPWTAAEVALVAFGDADAVSVGDYHLPHMVSWWLAGEPRGTDARMLELLEPYRGHRGRVLRLLEHAPSRARRAPRRRLSPIRDL